jgi:hypothetical protein
MSSAKEFFGSIFRNRVSEETEITLGSPYCMTISKDEFCKIKIFNLYKKILHRVYSRTEGTKDENKIASLFDSKERSDAQSGLISLLAMSMVEQKEIAIVYKYNIARIATEEEKKLIENEYKENITIVKMNKNGVLVNFKSYCLTDIMEAYMSMLYDILSSMNTQVGLAKALQIKISNLRATVSKDGKDEPINQAKDINASLKAGRSVLMDEKDKVETLTINSESTQAAFQFVCSLIASELGVSLSFVTGELTTGMSATGEADQNADEYGFQDFFNSIFKPVCDRLYDWNLTFISDDWRYFSSMIGSLIAVENSGLLSPEQKKSFADRLMPTTKK